MAFIWDEGGTQALELMEVSDRNAVSELVVLVHLKVLLEVLPAQNTHYLAQWLGHLLCLFVLVLHQHKVLDEAGHVQEGL